MKIKVTQDHIDSVQSYTRCPIANAPRPVIEPFEFDPDAFVKLMIAMGVFRDDNQSNTR